MLVRWTLRLVVLTLALALLAAGAAWLVLRGTPPALDGQRGVSGLAAPVEIRFDEFAVPHVYARDADDAWFTVGYLHGRERLWQMELGRRATAGRLSELFGPVTLRADRRFLGLGLRKAALAEWNRTKGPVRTALERYAAGVNAAMAEMGRWRRPAEFLLLGIEPEPWTPVDSLAFSKVMAWRLAENRHGELVRGAVARRFGAAGAAQLMGAWPADAPSIIDTGATTRFEDPKVPGFEGPKVQGRTPPDPQSLPPSLGWLDVGVRAGGSNSWVVSGARTKTGRPMLANDPHLAVEMPGIWYEAHVVASTLDVAGLTLPGTPFVVIGHNRHIAWGLTNTGADVQDHYVEEVDMTRRQYLFRGEWLPLQVERHEIAVRGDDTPSRFEVFRTRHGPLVADESQWEEPPVLSGLRGRVRPRPIALRWESVAEGETAGAFEAIDRATNWDEFLAGVRRFASPSQNFVYADVAGHVGYAMSGSLPERSAGDGSLPSPGWTGDREWTGTVDPARLPAVLDPPAGQIVTANAEVDRGWPGMTRDWTAPFRTRRIVALLGDRRDLDRTAFEEIQADVRSEAADRLLTALESALRSAVGARVDAAVRTAADRLRLWDRRVDGRPVAALYQAFERALWRRTFADEMDATLFARFFEYGASERYVGIWAVLDDPSASWWDDIATIDRRETRHDIMLLAAADAVHGLRAKFGAEGAWAWDRLHAVRFRHPLAAGGAPLDWFFSRGPVPLPGDSTTVRKSTVDPRSPYQTTEISSYRLILDVGAWDESRGAHPTGQSGHPQSPHYFDQNALWQAARTRPMPFSRAAVEKSTRHRLMLIDE